MASVRATPSVSASQFSPFKLAFGIDMKWPSNGQISVPNDTGNRTADEYMKTMLPRIELIRQIAKENILASQKVYKQQYDKRSKLRTFRVGDRVWLSRLDTPINSCRKLLNKFYGPFYITEFKPPVTYWLRDCTTHKNLRHPVHVDRLKPFNDFREQLDIQETDISLQNKDNQLTADTNVTTQDGDQKLNHGGVNTPAHGSQHNQTQQNTQWYTVKKVLRSRGGPGKRQYLVLWEEDNTKSWVLEKDVNQYLKESFHASKTTAGRGRKRRQ